MKNIETVLVTGGTGFVGAHTIVQLLQKGYKVKTTIRSLKRKKDVFEMLKNRGITSFDNLEFIEADLTKDENWDKAVKNCEYVLHMASPFPSGEPKDENELIIPAKQGTLRVLNAAQKANVKRVVMTSSFAAIGYSIEPKHHIFTEEDWTDTNAEIGAYIKSKTLAEKAAWNFIETEGNTLELTVINPVGIFGPVLGKDFASSVNLIEKMMSGKMPAIPKVSFGVVDVRDVADIHIKAMTNPLAKGQRFLATSDGTTSLPEIAKLLHVQPKEYAKKVSTKVLPNWLVKILANFKPELKAVATQVGRVKILSNTKAKNILDWKPRNQKEVILDTAESLIKFGIIK
ncbi:SDR family oxidoreductase [Algibacter lectus]|uniref:NADPH-dependent methylglyoxal reductase n=1 Tax=Algibacter lectus TaxID=221126 RepID=A0A090VI47_9FLAO|nr:aldehyde reductase [Algibacter lectus]GAL63743.1 NADPH-dependent methylglyoxal reductase [Algibacter lectus]SFB91722.1 dihydroflavonol-4-reductase [Algibacter lectus]